jgi:uncharacterized protein (DUF1330 family)
MAAYVVLNIEITDPVRYPDYVKVAGETVQLYGGRFLVRGGKAEKLEGSVEPKRIVILEFPSIERAKEWWNSAEYREPKSIRQAASVSETILVEGVESTPS